MLMVLHTKLDAQCDKLTTVVSPTEVTINCDRHVPWPKKAATLAEFRVGEEAEVPLFWS